MDIIKTSIANRAELPVQSRGNMLVSVSFASSFYLPNAQTSFSTHPSHSATTIITITILTSISIDTTITTHSSLFIR